MNSLRTQPSVVIAIHLDWCAQRKNKRRTNCLSSPLYLWLSPLTLRGNGKSPPQFKLCMVITRSLSLIVRTRGSINSSAEDEEHVYVLAHLVTVSWWVIVSCGHCSASIWVTRSGCSTKTETSHITGSQSLIDTKKLPSERSGSLAGQV